MSADTRRFVLSLLPKTFAICKLPADADVPRWAAQGSFVSVTRSKEELSVVAEWEQIPELLRTGGGWRILKVHGPFDLSEVGVLAAMVGALAQAGVSVFVISTFDTDYLLTRWEQLQQALVALRQAGHTVHAS